MPLRNAKALTFRPKGVTDAVDGTNAVPGALAAAADLIFSVHTKGVLVPRPAAFKFFDAGGRGEELTVVGTRIYGMRTSATIPGHSEPFLYDALALRFIPIAGITAANTPISTSPPPGEWIPPTAAPVGAYILFTHPGFSMPISFGWLDMTGFSDAATGDAASPGTTIVNLSKNVLNAGWRPGQIITDSAGVIPASTRIASISTDGMQIGLSQSTTGTATGDVLSVLGGSPDQPVWAAGNTNTNPLPFVARAVSQFNGRAYFAVKSATPFSDALDPLERTNASQVLTFDNGLDVTAFGTIPFSTTVGGIIQSLLAFQADEAIQQITGDPATSNLSKNLLAEIGTLAPNAIVSTPDGLLFVAPDGLRLVDQVGTVSPPVGAEGDGVALPFVNAIYPSRMCASYNEDVIRISVTYDTAVGGSVTGEQRSGEFWFHLKLKSWSGPHSFPAALIAPLDLAQTRHGHVMFPLSADGVWFSNTRPMIDSSYTENGVELTWLYETSLLPDNELMFMNGMNETTVMIALPTGAEATVAMTDEAGSLLNQVKIQGVTPPPGLWGSMIWGAGRWGGPAVPAGIWGKMIWGSSIWGAGVGGAVISQRLIPWDREIVFKQGQIFISGKSAPEVAIGNLYMRYQITGYTLQELQGTQTNGA